MTCAVLGKTFYILGIWTFLIPFACPLAVQYTARGGLCQVYSKPYSTVYIIVFPFSLPVNTSSCQHILCFFGIFPIRGKKKMSADRQTNYGKRPAIAGRQEAKFAIVLYMN
jgi:hypothetical protein